MENKQTNDERVNGRKAAWYDPKGPIFAIVAILTGVGAIGAKDVATAVLNPPAPHVQMHCNTIYDKWSDMIIAGKEEAAAVLRPEIHECNLSNSGAVEGRVQDSKASLKSGGGNQ